MILLGDGLEGAGGFKIDFVAAGFGQGPNFAPALSDLDRIKAIYLYVTKIAVTAIVEAGPELSWIHLKYADYIGHRDGDGLSMDLSARWIDTRGGELWSAVEARKKKAANEDWLALITSDHGRRSSDGRGHGGQSDRERTIWIASNSPRIVPTCERTAAMVNNYPTSLEYMRFELFAEVAVQLEGQSLFSK